MPGLLDGDGWLLTGLCGIVQPWEQADSVEVLQGAEIAEVDQSRKEVYETDCLGAALTRFACSGGTDQEGNTRSLFPEGALVPVPFFPEMPSMIGPEDNNSVPVGLAVLEGGENASDEGVGKRDAGEVMTYGTTPFASLAKAGKVAALALGERPPRLRDVLEVGRKVLGNEDILKGIQVEVVLGNIPGQVGVEEAACQKEWPAGPLLGKSGEIIHRVFGNEGVIIVILGDWKDSPVCFTGVELDAGVGKFRRAGFSSSPRVEGRAMPDPPIIIKEVALELVPLAWGIVACGVVVDLSAANGMVAVFTEVNRDGAQVGPVWFPPVLIVVDPGGGGKKSAQNRGPTGTADRGGAVGICEDSAPGRQAIEIWSMDLAGVAAEEPNPVVEVVKGDEEDVILRGFSNRVSW